jgi:hypothetical protein
VQVHDTVSGTGFISASSASVTADSSLTDSRSGAYGPELVLDQSPATYWSSAASGDKAWLQLDLLGVGAPFHDQLSTVVVYQPMGTGVCQEMLECYSMDVLGEKQEVGADARLPWRVATDADGAVQIGRVS